MSDLPGVAQVTDPNLVNPWGISESGGSPFWISDNNAGVSTLYNTPGQNGAPIAINPLVVSIPTPGDPPAPAAPPPAPCSTPTAGTGGFKVSGFTRNRGSDVGLGGLPVRHRGRHHRRLEPRRQSRGL